VLVDAGARAEAARAHAKRCQLAVGADPLDARELRIAARDAAYAAHDVKLARLGPTPELPLDDCWHERVAEQLGELRMPYLHTMSAADDAHGEAHRLAEAPSPPTTDGLALHALFERPQGRLRERTVLRLGGHLLARGVDPGVAVGMLEAWDADRCTPPLGSERVEALLRWVARRQAEKIERAA